MPPKWVIDRTRSLTIRNTQLHLCEREQQPLVHVEPGRKYATVVLDMVSIPVYSITAEGQTEIEEVFDSSGGWIACIGEHYCSAKRVPIAEAESVATRVFDIDVRCKKLRHASRNSTVPPATLGVINANSSITKIRIRTTSGTESPGD